MSGKYVLYKHVGILQQYHWVLKASNGETILRSENYTTEAMALNGIRSVQVHCTNDNNYKRLTATNGSPYFNLYANNGKVIGTSEMYSTAQARDNGIESVKQNGVTTTIVSG